MRTSTLATAVAAAVVVALLTFVPAGSPPQQVQQPAATVPVERADVVCPPMPAAGDARAAVTAPVLGRDSGSGSLETNPVQVRAGGSTVSRLGARGEVWRGDGGAVGGGLRAHAEGALAAGLSGMAVSDLDDEGASGLSTAACVGPASSWWFVGAGSSVGRDDTLVLTNASPAVAVVDLTFYGPEGRVEDVDSKQIPIEPGAVEQLPLADFVPGVGDVAIEVSVTQGRVAAALSETRTDASESQGSDFVGAAVAPATRTAITGVPSGPGRRDLLVVNNGESETVVEVEVLGRTGAYQPSEFDVLRVPAGAVVSRQITGITREEVAGLRLSAEEPVTAAVRSTAPAPDGPDDVAYAPAAEALSAGTAAPVPQGVEPTLVLSSIHETAATARVRVFDASGEQIGEHELEVGAGQTVAWDVRGQGRPASFVVDSADGDQLAGAVHWESDEGRSITALTSLESTVDRPALRYDLGGR